MVGGRPDCVAAAHAACLLSGGASSLQLDRPEFNTQTKTLPGYHERTKPHRTQYLLGLVTFSVKPGTPPPMRSFSIKVKYDGVWTPAKDRRPGRDERSSEVSKFVAAIHNKRNAVPACFHEVHALYLHVRPCLSSSAPLWSSPPYLGGSLVIAKSMRARRSCTGPHLLHHTTTFGQELLRHGPSLLSVPFF